MIRRDFQVIRRPSATAEVNFEGVLVERAVEQARDLAGLALRMVAEDEVRRAHVGQTIPFGPWLGGRITTSSVIEGVLDLVETIVRMRLDPAYDPTSFQTTKSIAKFMGKERTRLLRDPLHPRAQMVPVMMAAASAVDGLVGPVDAYLTYAHGGKAGRDAQVFGTHKESGAGAIGRVMGLAATGPDTIVPVTMQALVADTRDDPFAARDSRRHAAEQARAATGYEVPRTMSSHFGADLLVLSAARRLVIAAGEAGSPACADAGIKLSDLYEVGFSDWAVLGTINVGPRVVARNLNVGRPIYPGVDSKILGLAESTQMEFLAYVADNRTTPDTLQHAKLAYDFKRSRLPHHRVLHALLNGEYKLIPSLQETPREVIQLAEQSTRKTGIDAAIGAKYLTVNEGLQVLSDDGSEPVTVSALLRVDMHMQTLLWTSTANLSMPEALASAIARAELHVRSMRDRRLLSGVPQFFDDHDIHRFQASHYAQHVAIRVVMMMANIADVGTARAHQTGRGPT